MVCVLQTKARKAEKIGTKNKVNNCMSVASHYLTFKKQVGFLLSLSRTFIIQLDIQLLMKF